MGVQKITSAVPDIAGYHQARGSRVENFPRGVQSFGVQAFKSYFEGNATHMKWTEITVSMVKSVTDTHPTPVKLGHWLRAMKVSNIDHIPKKNRAALMPHGEFLHGRGTRHMVRRSGLIQFDIDVKQNPQLNTEEIKRRASAVPWIVMCARSAGAGVWGLALRQGCEDQQLTDIARRLGVVLDTANSRNVAALRFAAYDPHPHIK